MALSNSFDFTLSSDALIQEAMERCGMLRLNKAATSDQLASLRRSLNLKCKAAQADGLELFTYRDAYLFLEEDEDDYLLGPTGDHATEIYVRTAIGADEAAGQTALTVDSITGISNGDNLGIELDDGTLQWTTVNGVPSGTTVTATAALTSAAAAGNVVFAYTTKIQRPLSIADLFIRDVDDNDVPVQLRSISEHRSLTNKLIAGRTVQVTYDPQLTNGRLLIYPAAEDVTEVLGFVYKKPVDDFDTALDVKASKLLTNTGNPANNDTVTIAGVVYTFKTTLTGAANEILIGATATLSFDNLKAAINDIGGAEGTDYGAATSLNPSCIATSKTATTLLVEAREAGTGGNSIAIAESSSVLSWAGAATALSGGTDSNAPAFPVDFQEWLVCELCVVVGEKFSLPLMERKWFKDQAKDAKSDLWDNEDTTIQIVPSMRR